MTEIDATSSGLCEVGADRVTCIVADPDHRRIYHGGSTLGDVATTLLAAEPESVDVLDLVRQYGDQTRMLAERRPQMAAANAERWDASNAELFARIEAEVNRLRAEADATGFLAAVNKLTIEREDARAQVRRLNAEAERVTDELVKARDERDQALADVERWRERVLDPLPDPSAPLVLRLPEVPEGAVALIGVESGIRYPRREGTVFWLDPGRGNATTAFTEVLEIEGSVTVVMAPPREPRTPLDDVQDLRDELTALHDGGYAGKAGHAFSIVDKIENAIRALTGEVFDDKDGTR